MGELTIYTILFRSLLAVAVGAFIGLERGSKNQSAGIRTHSLVCLGAAIIMMTNLFVSIKYQIGDPTRMGAQVVNGIGFLGAGTILVTNENKVRGLTTAAGVWLAAAIGLAIGIGFYQIAILSVPIIWAVLTALQEFKKYVQIRSKVMELYLIVDSTEAYNRVLIYCAEHKIRVTDSKTAFGEANKDRLELVKIKGKKIASFLTLSLHEHFEHLKILEEISEIPGVQYVEET